MTGPVFYHAVTSPIGDLLLTSDGEALTGLQMEGPGGHRPDPQWVSDEERLAAASRQLAEYFRGERTTFDLPLAPRGTPFQREVWAALRNIPYGRTESYGAVARRIGRPKAIRAVGAANGRNPIAIIVPCHRVIGSDGRLVGFGGGLERKRTLLDLEARANAAIPARGSVPRPVPTPP